MAKIDRVLGTVSPLYGAISGQGMFGGLQKLSALPLVINALKDKKDKKPGVAEATAGPEAGAGMKRGGKIKAKKMAKGGSVSARADGCATKGKTKGRFV